MSRYSQIHYYNHIQFLLSPPVLDIEQSKFLLFKVVVQAEHDYINFYMADMKSHQEIWESARAFIFEEDYVIDWGDLKLSFNDILDIVDEDRLTVLRRMHKKMEERYGPNYRQEKERRSAGIGTADN